MDAIANFDVLDIDLNDLFKDEFTVTDNVSATQILAIPTQDIFKEEPSSDANCRFAAPVTTDDLKKQHTDAVPKKTRQSNNWAYSLWKDWAEHRNRHPETAVEPGFPIPLDVGQIKDNALLNYWIQRFIVEIRRKDGNAYPPSTLTQITSALQRYLRTECGLDKVNFFLESDPTFADFRRTLDAKMKELTAQGVGVKSKKADPITREDEGQLWDSGVFSLDSSTGISNAIFFYNGKAFGFRGYQEHLDCQAEQFEILFDHSNKRKYVQFTPRVRKNSQGGLKHKKINIQPVIHYDQAEEVNISICKLYETYLSLIPRKGPLYRKPLAGTDENGNLRFSCGTIPQNSLRQMIKRFFEQANIEMAGRNITNHSARVSLCTTLYNERFSEKAVKSRSQHRSGAVQEYQRENFGILSDLSNVLEPPIERFPKVAPTATEAKPPPVYSQDDTDECLTISVPKCVKKIVLMKEGRRIVMDI